MDVQFERVSRVKDDSARVRPAAGSAPQGGMSARRSLGSVARKHQEIAQRIEGWGAEARNPELLSISEALRAFKRCQRLAGASKALLQEPIRAERPVGVRVDVDMMARIGVDDVQQSGLTRRTNGQPSVATGWTLSKRELSDILVAKALRPCGKHLECPLVIGRAAAERVAELRCRPSTVTHYPELYEFRLQGKRAL